MDEPRDLPAAAAAYQALRPDLGIVISYGRLIPRALLSLPAHGMLGVHPSLLPRYRGASPVVWPLLNGDSATGVTVFRLNERMDAGDMLLQRQERIAPRDTVETLSSRLASIGAGLLTEGLAAIEQGTASFHPQDEGAATYTTKLTKAHGRLRWAEDAAVIDRQIRALNPWPGTVASWQGEPLKILSASLAAADTPAAKAVKAERSAGPDGGPASPAGTGPARSVGNPPVSDTPSSAGTVPTRSPAGLGPAASPAVAPGTVLAVGDGICVATGRGVIVVHELQRAGGRRLTAREFLAGHPLRAGDRLGDGQGTDA